MKAAFGVEARVEPFHGAWVDLPEEDLTRLGGRDAGNARLGSTACSEAGFLTLRRDHPAPRPADGGTAPDVSTPLPPERAAPTCLHWSAGIWGTWGVR
ncbi:MAG: type VI secretion system baseplate subunit TssG [Bilophila wadsworthia]